MSGATQAEVCVLGVGEFWSEWGRCVFGTQKATADAAHGQLCGMLASWCWVEVGLAEPEQETTVSAGSSMQACTTHVTIQSALVSCSPQHQGPMPSLRRW